MQSEIQPTQNSFGKIIRLETYFTRENSYIDYMWVRIYVDKFYSPLITPFFEFKEVFLGEAYELEKLIDSEREWRLQNTKDSTFRVLSDQKNDFIYASISKIIYSKNFSSKPYFNFQKIEKVENGDFYRNRGDLEINFGNEKVMNKKWEEPYDMVSYSKGNYILVITNHQTLKREILMLRHSRLFYEEKFFKLYNDERDFFSWRELHNSRTQIKQTEQTKYTIDDIVNDAFEGDYSNLWNID